MNIILFQTACIIERLFCIVLFLFIFLLNILLLHMFVLVCFSLFNLFKFLNNMRFFFAHVCIP